MTSLDPSHLPAGHRNKPSRGQAIYRVPGASGSRALTIPDLRFEQSYLRSLQRFIHDTPRHPGVAGKGKARGDASKGEKAVDTAGMDSRVEAAAPGMYGIPVKIDWGWVLWVTSRDQVLSPLAQGAIWAVASLFLRPLLANVGARVRIHFQQFWRSIFPPLEPHIHGGAGWMRNQLREFTVGGVGTNIALAK